MYRRWLSRALIALAAPVVLAPALAPAATAAASYPDVPTIEAAAKVYSHLEGGTANETTTKVFGPGKKCKSGKAINGAGARMATYSPDYTSGDPSAFEITGETPSVYVQAMKFPTTKAAIRYLHGYAKHTKKCPSGSSGGGHGGKPDCKASMKKIKFSLGNERWGYQIKSKCEIAGRTTHSVFNTLFARSGKFIVYTGAMSMDATAPSIPKSIAFTKTALKTAS
jgi:hypothetical protein